MPSGMRRLLHGHLHLIPPAPAWPGGKPAGTACVNLDREGLCLLHGTAAYPKVCREFTPTREICGLTNDHARRFLAGYGEADRAFGSGQNGESVKIGLKNIDRTGKSYENVYGFGKY